MEARQSLQTGQRLIGRGVLVQLDGYDLVKPQEPVPDNSSAPVRPALNRRGASPDAIDLGKQGAGLVMSYTKPSRGNNADNAENRQNDNEHPKRERNPASSERWF